ncbi:class A sortase [Lactobacillus taiwanensis]|jgi:LPXTG-site transpeptidase (sortase) family protein|uniref:class A sortase n=1 Tax=Lactobacillus taiwanensis TaxID=508451 RepID=UPI000B991D24|nr:class A sortase [Lactobacillus taiwanensis]MCR1916642.1 class A sortase [Lactobacillus taiwanensis]OYR95626.1 class A sortase [Lactobacillus taiwanensis]OYR99992.1 class A sortase [Lactobacillus taiwanensis]OYS15895.1 class A sortase [Lactobacillus taiwanensis]OYS20777.1 class A sortase [Lactobacillus taiwanensis]
MTKHTKNTTKKTWIIRIVAIILLIVGLGMIFNSQIRDIMVRQNQTTALKKLNKETVKKNQKKEGMFDFSKVEEIDFGQVTKSRVKNTADAIGAIAVPSVNMYLPIMKGLSNDAMSTGGGTMRPDQVMGKGNYPLAGHYMTAKGVLFSPLENTKIGEKVYLTNLDKIYVYRIYMKKIVDPTAVWLVDNTKQNIVTLITCADGGVNRWAIRGKLITEKPATDKNLQVFKLK